MALSKDEIQLLKEMIADDSISKQEKDMYREMLGDTPATASKPAKKKATKKKSTPKKKKVSESDIDKMKAQIKQRTGKTEEECEKIVEEYRALRKKATTRKKKETATKEKSKQRTTKLKKEGKVIEGTTEKNVEATIDTATKTATKKVDKEITKIEKTTKGEKQVEKKIDQLVKKALASSKKFVSDMAKELSTKSKDDGRTYLMGLRSQIDALLKKYELGGEVFDGSGDSINFGSGGFTSSYNIQDGMISVGNNVKFEEGGDVFDGSGDSVNFAKGGMVEYSKEGNVKAIRNIDGKMIKEVVVDGVKYRRNSTYKTYNSIKDNQLLHKSKYAKGGKIDFKDKNKYRNTSGKPNWDKISEKDLKENYKKNKLRDRITYEEFKEIFTEQGVEVYAKGGSIQTRAKKLAKKDGKDLDKVSDKEYMKYRMMAQEQIKERGGNLDDYDLSTYGGSKGYINHSIKQNEKIIKKMDNYLNSPMENSEEEYRSREMVRMDKAKLEAEILRLKDELKEYAKGGSIAKGGTTKYGEKFFITNVYTDRLGRTMYDVRFENDEKMYSIPKLLVEQEAKEVYAKGGMSQGYNDRLDESLGSRRGTSMSHHQNYKDRRDESKGMETGMGRRAYRGVDTMDNN